MPAGAHFRCKMLHHMCKTSFMRRENGCMKPSHEAADGESAMLYMSIPMVSEFPLSTITVMSKWKLIWRLYTEQLLITGSKY